MIDHRCVEVDAAGGTVPLSIPEPSAALDVSFFVPCYNEQSNIVGALTKLREAARGSGLTYEILVFDDCSQDRSVSVVNEYRSLHPDEPVRLFCNAVNMGVSRNFFEGAFQARGRYYRLICGDDIEPLDTHLAVLKQIGKADIVVPYFTEIRGRSFVRHCISRAYTLLVNFVSGYRLHYYNGCPLYRRADVVRFHVETTGFGYQAEFLTRLLREGRHYIEIPLTSMDREGSGSLSVRNFVSVGHSLLKIALRRLRITLFK